MRSTWSWLGSFETQQQLGGAAYTNAQRDLADILSGDPFQLSNDLQVLVHEAQLRLTGLVASAHGKEEIVNLDVGLCTSRGSAVAVRCSRG
jgi:hypothetical protein